MRALMLSTYELGHQPLHVASPAGALLRAGHEVRCIDLSVEPMDPGLVSWADAVAFSVPMHTALRLARVACEQVRALRPEIPVCFYGLYAGIGDGCDGPDMAIAGEYEPNLLSWIGGLGSGEQSAGTEDGKPASVVVHIGRQSSGLPARHLLPPLQSYARLVVGPETRLAGYVEASHGCAHRCRHCPVPVVYDGRTRLVGVDAVVADVAQLIELGARHITFGDPDFLNGPHHARRVVAAVHGAYPHITFDVTAKVEHILNHRNLWPEMADAGCIFAVSAFESASDSVLERLAKGHTVADEVEAVAVLRGAGIEPRPSLLPFTPWTTAAEVLDLLDLVARCDLVGNIDSVQYSIRLLVPPGSLLLDSNHLNGMLGAYDAERLGWTWRSADPRLDRLQKRLAEVAEEAGDEGWGTMRSYEAVRAAALDALGHDLSPAGAPNADPGLRSPLAADDRPRLSEAWFCCAEPTDGQFRAARRYAPVVTGGR
ncbi:MAG: CUAEP/CCAEP-tail radical SAM (seleno)protein [Acidimicrobiales bacterium]